MGVWARTPDPGRGDDLVHGCSRLMRCERVSGIFLHQVAGPGNLLAVGANLQVGMLQMLC